MSDPDPPVEQQRFARSQTPESPRPVHIPEPSTIPVLLNQMDPVFNDTATYNIPSNQTFSPYGESLENANLQNPSNDEHDAVQSFFREAENQTAAAPPLPSAQNESTPEKGDSHQFPSLPTVDESSKDQMNTQNQPHLEIEPKPSILENVESGIENGGVTSKGTDSAAVNESSNAQDRNTDQEKDGQPVNNMHAISAIDQTGVDYQSLLDTISNSTSTAPAADAMTVPTTGSSYGEQSTGSLPSFPGLPPKPPPQENPNDFPTYPDHAQPSTYPFPASAQDETSQALLNGQANLTHADLSSAINPIVTAIEQSSIAFDAQTSALSHTSNTFDAPPNFGQTTTQSSSDIVLDANGYPSWPSETRALYERFLEDERRYVTEGIWDRFPVGSRLFVGNLPSEKVTKRDLFHYFHKHGRLAQISIKQAYGFVQYHDSESCLAALNAEQGVEIRGRKVHLEISKPQKNTRGAGSGGNKAQARRRSRSPDRNQRRFTEFRDDTGRRRDEFRNRRSSSPRGYRDEIRPGSANRSDRRSPVYSSSYGISPTNPYADDESSLPIARRDPRHVPDVQLIIVDQGVHQSFINWVEDGFRRKGLQANTIWLGQRLSLVAVVKRQIVEGVQAVVKLSSAAQARSKIPLQVFDRTAGASNVNFNEYADLDVHVAADVVIQARQREQTNIRSPFTPSFSTPSPYGQPPPNMGFPPVPPQFAQQPQQSPNVQQGYQYHSQSVGSYRPAPQQNQVPTPASQPPNLQELLANLKSTNNPPTPQSAQSTGSRPDLAGLLGNVARQQGQQLPISPYQSAQSYQTYGNQNVGQQQYTNQQSPNGAQQQNVQNIMAELARYQR